MAPRSSTERRASFLILHGIGNRRPPEHWQFHLAATLREDGHQTSYPQLPDPDAPILDAWATVLAAELRLLGGERTVVCHSLSCLLWMLTAPSLDPALRPERVLLVSPPAADRLPDGGADFRRPLGSAAEIRASAGNEIRIVASDADPFNPTGAAELYARPLGIDFDLIPGAGHITPADGYGPWPSVVGWCKGTAERLVTNDS